MLHAVYLVDGECHILIGIFQSLENAEIYLRRHEDRDDRLWAYIAPFDGVTDLF